MLGINADGEPRLRKVSADWDIVPGLRLGGNYTYLEQLRWTSPAPPLDFPASINAAAPRGRRRGRLEGTPRHEAFIYLAWQATHKPTLTPSVEITSDRSSLVTSADSTLLSTPSSPNYVKVGSYALVNFQAESQFDQNFGARSGPPICSTRTTSLRTAFPRPGGSSSPI